MISRYFHKKKKSAAPQKTLYSVIISQYLRKSKDFDTYHHDPLLPRGFLLLFPHFIYTSRAYNRHFQMLFSAF
jgi:hypothetical protein